MLKKGINWWTLIHKHYEIKNDKTYPVLLLDNLTAFYKHLVNGW